MTHIETLKRVVLAFDAPDGMPELCKAIDDMRQAVEQAEQAKPVGEVYRYGKDSKGSEWHGIYWYDANVSVPTGTKLYTAPPPHQPWVGLTDEEMHACWDSPLTPLGMKHARMIEAKLKEKNA